MHSNDKACRQFTEPVRDTWNAVHVVFVPKLYVVAPALWAEDADTWLLVVQLELPCYRQR